MTQETLFRYFKGQADAEEQRSIGAWLLTGEDAFKEFEQAQFLFEGMVLHRPARESGAIRRYALRPRRFYRSMAAVAASLLLVLGTAFGVRHATTESLSHQFMSLAAEAGQRANVTLADGSVVTLNSGARIEYPVTFKGKERRVRIEGEALFKVSPDAGRPFIVSTYAADIKVLGTTFDVVAYEDEDVFSTTLMEGSVHVTNASDPSDSHLMRPGEVVTLCEGKLRLSALDDPDSLSWVDGLVSLKAKDFASLMKLFERVYGVQIVVATSPSIGNLSGELRISEGIEHALTVLQHVIDFEYEIYDGTIVVK